MSDPVLIAAPLLFSAVLVVALCGLSAAKAMVVRSRRVAVSAAVGGAMALWAAPLLVLTQRSTDAPPGTEVLFLTTSSWAFLLTIGVMVAGQRTAPLATMAGSLTALAGAAGLLANWERPSSFSPFIRYTERELLMLTAGVIFAVGILLIWKAFRSESFRAVAVIAMTGAVAAGGVGLLFDRPSIGTLTFSLIPLLLLGMAQAAFTWGWFTVTERQGPVIPAAALMLVPAAVTALSMVERATGVYGANPIVWNGAGGAIAVMLAGTTAMVMPQVVRGGVIEPPATTGPKAVMAQGALLPKIELVMAAFALVAGIVSLALPTLAASSRGVGVDGANFAADWMMLGAESAAAWVAFGAALLAAAAVLYAVGKQRALLARVLAAAAFVASIGSMVLFDTALHTLTRWIPAEVQQAYGTEYARMSVESVVNPAMYASLLATVLVALLVLWSAGAMSAGNDITEEVS